MVRIVIVYINSIFDAYGSNTYTFYGFEEIFNVRIDTEEILDKPNVNIYLFYFFNKIVYSLHMIKRTRWPGRLLGCVFSSS